MKFNPANRPAVDIVLAAIQEASDQFNTALDGFYKVKNKYEAYTRAVDAGLTVEVPNEIKEVLAANPESLEEAHNLIFAPNKANHERLTAARSGGVQTLLSMNWPVYSVTISGWPKGYEAEDGESKSYAVTSRVREHFQGDDRITDDSESSCMFLYCTPDATQEVVEYLVNIGVDMSSTGEVSVHSATTQDDWAYVGFARGLSSDSDSD